MGIRSSLLTHPANSACSEGAFSGSQQLDAGTLVTQWTYGPTGISLGTIRTGDVTAARTPAERWVPGST